MSTIWAVILAAGIPSAVFGILVRQINNGLDKRDREKAEREQARVENQKYLIRAVMVSLSLGEATAEAVQRIPDAHCNGDMDAALKSVKEFKEEYREFERERTAKSLV